MYRTAALTGALLATLAPALARADGEVAADRNPIAPGQSVTLRWYFTGTKVLVSGGRFGQGAIVTGKSSLTDKPLKSTRYTFEVDYMGKGAGDDTKLVPLHARYSILVEVVDPRALGLVPYTDTRGFTVQYMKGWQRDNVSLPDPSNNALIFFQPEDDALERLAVAVMPVTDTSSAALADKVLADMPSHYDKCQVVSRKETTFEGKPAVAISFTGNDQGHPETKSQSVVLAFVRDGRGYVISARTAAARYAARQTLLNAMVNSFSFSGKPSSTASRAQ